MKILPFSPVTKNSQSVTRAFNLTNVNHMKLEQIEDYLNTIDPEEDVSAHIASLIAIGNKIDNVLRLLQSSPRKKQSAA